MWCAFPNFIHWSWTHRLSCQGTFNCFSSNAKCWCKVTSANPNYFPIYVKSKWSCYLFLHSSLELFKNVITNIIPLSVMWLQIPVGIKYLLTLFFWNLFRTFEFTFATVLYSHWPFWYRISFDTCISFPILSQFLSYIIFPAVWICLSFSCQILF